MSALILYDRITDPIGAMVTMGNAIGKSQMFGCSSIEQGQVFAMECLARKIPPLTLAKKYHIIFGKLSQKADDMLSEFIRAGGKSKILERTPDCVSVELTFDGNTRVFSLTWETAKGEAFPYEGKEKDIVKLLLANKKPELKPKYATPHSRMQMLWARLISDAIRATAPDINSGVYTPEELEDAAELDGTVIDGEFQVVKGEGAEGKQPRKTAAELIAEQEAAVAEVVAEKTEVVQPVEEVKQATTTPNPAATNALPESLELCNSAQRARILELYAACELSQEEMDKVLSKRKIGGLHSLTLVDAAELIGKLEVRFERSGKAVEWQKKKQAEEAAKDFQASEQPAKEVADIDSAAAFSKPCTVEQQQKIRELLAIEAQKDPQAPAFFKQMLNTSGRQKIADLDIDQAEELIVLIPQNKWQAFFTPPTKEEVPFA